MIVLQKQTRLSSLSTFRVGGIADYFTEVETIEELQSALDYAKRHSLPFHIVGKGSNSLFDDQGFRGLIILNKINFCEIQENQVYVGAGFSFSLLGVKTAKLGLSGLEFAAGIPGSVGGAIFMNAGASGSETSQSLTHVLYLDEWGQKKLFSKEELFFGYRFSSFQNRKGAIAAAQFSLAPSPEARQKQLEIIHYRTKTQPYDAYSCGCVFRNPENGKAGALIDQCGLKGMRMGGAKISPVHANFIVNEEDATAKDILSLAAYVQNAVKERTGIQLEMELQIIPQTKE